MKKILFILPVIALLLCSCNKASDITVDEDNVTFAINGGEKTIVVTADGSYDIEDCPEWVKTSVDESALTISVGENTTGAKRECVIRLVGKDVEVPITIFQADKCTYIKTSETEVTIPKEGGEVTLDVETDGGNLAMNCPEGIEAKLTGGKLTITAPANQGGTIDGTVTLSCDNVNTEVKVTVEGNICPTCNGTGKVRCAGCGGRGYLEYTGGWDRVGCKKCGGGGTAMLSFSGHGLMGDVRNGSGKMNCPTCGGSGH